MSSSLSSSIATASVSSVQLARDPGDAPTESASAGNASSSNASPVSTSAGGPAAPISATSSSSDEKGPTSSAPPPPASTSDDKPDATPTSSSSDTPDASPLSASATITIISPTTQPLATPLPSAIFDSPIPSHLTTVPSQLLPFLTPITLSSPTISSQPPSQPTTFSILRRPTPIIGVPTSTKSSSSASSTNATTPSPATKRTNSSGVITGVVLAVLFLMMAAFVLRPQWTRKREVEVDEDKFDASSWKEIEGDCSRSSFEGSIEKVSSVGIDEVIGKAENHFVTFPRTRPTAAGEEVNRARSPALIAPPPPPPPLNREPPQPHSTPPLSGLYSPSAWATMLATPESRRCLTPNPHPLPNTQTNTNNTAFNSPQPSINISTFTRSDTSSGYASLHHNNSHVDGRLSPLERPLRSSLRTTIYDPSASSDTSSIYSSQTFNIGSPKLGGGGVFGRAGMGTEKMGMGKGMGMLLPVALVGGGAIQNQDGFPTTPGSDCPERF